MSAPSSAIAVIGAGATTLVEQLVGDGHRVIAVDISAAALELLGASVGAHPLLTLLQGDVRTMRLGELVDVWHDRAVFHFFVTEADRAAYAAQTTAVVRPGGHLVLAAFAVGGPTQCSGLPVQQHAASTITTAFSPSFELLETFETDHLTPWGSAQRFVHAVLRRR